MIKAPVVSAISFLRFASIDARNEAPREQKPHPAIHNHTSLHPYEEKLGVADEVHEGNRLVVLIFVRDIRRSQTYTGDIRRLR